MRADPQCSGWRSLSPEALDEPTRRAAWRRHLADCDSCRREAVAGDPVTAFCFLPDVELADDDVAAMRRAVSASLRQSRLRKPRSNRRWLLAGAAAVLLTLAAGSWQLTRFLPEAAVAPSEQRQASEVLPDLEHPAQLWTLDEGGPFVATQIPGDGIDLIVVANVEI